MFYIALFLLFVYFKIARVHKKEEKMSPLFIVQHIVIALSGIALFGYGFTHVAWYVVIGLSLVYFIISALIVTAVQLGIFVDGKPQFGISKTYKFMPVLTASIVIFTAILWT